MDVEARLVLYTVVLGAGAGLVLLVRRRVRGFLAYKLELAALFAVSLAGLADRDTARLVAWPSFWAFVAVAIVPSALVQVARRASRSRRFGLAAALTSGAALLLGGPVPLRREAALYAAMAAAERGDAAACRRRLERMERSLGIPDELGGAALCIILPAAAARRWDEVLAGLMSLSYRPPALLALEVRASIDTGDLPRALRACGAIAGIGPAFAAARTASRRWILAASGRAAFLAQAAARGLPVMSGPRGTSDLALGRAHEALGDVAAAATHYAAATRLAVGGHRLDAEAGARRCADGVPLVVRDGAIDPAEILALEEACRTETLPPDEAPIARRAPFTLGVSAVTAAVSLLVLCALGADGISLVSVGALSAPLIVHEGEWWRLGTTMLLHGGWFHLVMNLGAILFVGVPLETRMGPARTAIVYVGSGLLASLASVHIAGTGVGVGASGAAMGLVGAFSVLVMRRPAYFADAERRRWLGALGLTVVATLAVGLEESEAIDNAAHAAGLVAGAFIGWAMLPDPAEGVASVVARRLAAIASVALLIVCAAAAAFRFGEWRGERVVEFPGGRATLPSWLRVQPLSRGGLVASREPFEFVVQLGATPAEPDPLVVVPPDLEMRRLLLTAPSHEAEETLATGVSSNVADFLSPRRPDALGFRLRTFRAGAAFALVCLRLAPDGQTEGDDVAVRIGRSLAAAPE